MNVRIPVVVAVLLLTSCSSGGGGYGSSSSKKTPASTPSQAAPAGTALKIAGFHYDPSPLTVKPSDKITVTNSDSAEHTVTSDTSGLFTVSAEQGTPVTLTAPAKAGTYAYHCTIHPSMHGSLVVKP